MVYLTMILFVVNVFIGIFKYNRKCATKDMDSLVL